MKQDDLQRCAICRGVSGAICVTFSIGSHSSLGFDCECCGIYIVGDLAKARNLESDVLTVGQRSAVSHHIRTAPRISAKWVQITDEWLCAFLKNARIPSPSEQAINLIRIIGEHEVVNGDPYLLDAVNDYALVGSINVRFLVNLSSSLQVKGLIAPAGSSTTLKTRRGDVAVPALRLTLDGWNEFEAQKIGKFAGKYGFIALKFGVPELDALVDEWIRPHIKEKIGYDVVNLLHVSRAGVIDNIMREQIRDASFVISDLTHDNSGAYWEAGYAEGLGKPVIYICEKTKFDNAKTHFDVNHCTTVIWQKEQEEIFVNNLIATIRRSLNLF